MIKRLINHLPLLRKKTKIEMAKVMQRFTPGDTSLYLLPAERRIILSWLYRIESAAIKRNKEKIVKKISAIILALNK